MTCHTAARAYLGGLTGGFRRGAVDPLGEEKLRDPLVLVVQHDPDVSSRIEDELEEAGLRVAGPVADLEHASARVEGQVLSAVLLDLFLPGSSGASTVSRFQRRHPGLPVVASAPRAFETDARRALSEGARLYVLDEEVGRGLLAPLLRYVASSPDDGFGAPQAEHAVSGRLLHDLGNLLSVVSGESEMLVGRLDQAGGPMPDDIRALHDAITECVRTFRKFVASRRDELAERHL